MWLCFILCTGWFNFFFISEEIGDRLYWIEPQTISCSWRCHYHLIVMTLEINKEENDENIPALLYSTTTDTQAKTFRLLSLGKKSKIKYREWKKLSLASFFQMKAVIFLFREKSCAYFSYEIFVSFLCSPFSRLTF